MIPPTAIATEFLGEFQNELKITRRFLDRLPDSLLTWRPHDKSMTAGQLALHIAQAPREVLQLSLQDDAAPPDFMAGRAQPNSAKEILQALDQGADFVRKTLPTLDNARMLAEFRIVVNGRTVMAMPRMVFLRAIMFNHVYHHRGQFGVYLRLMGQKVPSSYGPSGDEEMPGM